MVSDPPLKSTQPKGLLPLLDPEGAAGFRSTKESELRFYTLLNEEAPVVSWQWVGTAGG
jgi:hypothetical protein